MAAILAIAVAGCVATESSPDATPPLQKIDWTTRFSPDIPYYNMSDDVIDIRSSPGSEAEVIGQLSPNDGGYIVDCDSQARSCKIAYGGYDAMGWVEMTKMSGVAN